MGCGASADKSHGATADNQDCYNQGGTVLLGDTAAALPRAKAAGERGTEVAPEQFARAAGDAAYPQQPAAENAAMPAASNQPSFKSATKNAMVDAKGQKDSTPEAEGISSPADAEPAEVPVGGTKLEEVPLDYKLLESISKAEDTGESPSQHEYAVEAPVAIEIEAKDEAVAADSPDGFETQAKKVSPVDDGAAGVIVGAQVQVNASQVHEKLPELSTTAKQATPIPRPALLSPEPPKHGGNAKVAPVKWSMSINQWNAFVDYCKATPNFDELSKEETKLANGKVVKPSGYVNGYQVCTNFVKPWTAGTGSGIALLMNEDPEDAELMLSHSWAQDIVEAQEALTMLAEKNGGPKPKSFRLRDKKCFSAESFPMTSRIWFCIFANYQNEDAAGPSISEQLAMNPFGSVIKSEVTTHMIVIHTTRAEVYDRLWCCYEVAEAKTAATAEGQGLQASGGREFTQTFIQAAFSNKYIEYADSAASSKESEFLLLAAIKSENATCSRDDDTLMITEKVMKDHGGFENLNRLIQDFRFGKYVIECPSAKSKFAMQGRSGSERWDIKPEWLEKAGDIKGYKKS